MNKLNPYLIRLVLTAGAIYFVFPMIPGVMFEGDFALALCGGILFSFLGWVVETIDTAFSDFVTVDTFWISLQIIVPLWLFGFLILPVIVLRFLAELNPLILHFSGWGPAICCGVIMLFFALATRGNINENGQHHLFHPPWKSTPVCINSSSAISRT